MDDDRLELIPDEEPGQPARSGNWTIAVVDDGPGIPIDQRDMAFDRFVRLGVPGSPEGSGLGLAIVRSAATRLNATVAFGDVRVDRLRGRALAGVMATPPPASSAMRSTPSCWPSPGFT